VDDTRHTAPIGPNPPGTELGPRRLVRIEHGRSWSARVRDVWAYRDLLYFLVWRDVKIRYRQTVFGVAWSVLQPLLFMLVFTLFATRIVNIPSNGVPYPLFAYAGLVVWTLFSQTLTTGSESLVREANLVSKVYFPRVILPIASAGSFVIDFLIGLVLLGVLMGWYGVGPPPEVLLLAPVFALLAVTLALALATWLSALNVMYRDVHAVVPFAVQLLLLLTPVAYSSDLISGKWRTIYGLNPMSGVIEGFRWSVLGTSAPDVAMVGVSIAMTLVILASGLAYFRRTERVFADII
jgi:lipopolysaccharide transport system permease protein